MSSTESPFVSVVVPSRGDRPALVRQTLTAILASTYTAFELVLVDQSDAGMLATLAEPLMRTDARLRVLRDEGKGASRARNLGAANTTGDLVIFTDDDCEVAPDWLALIVSAMEADRAAGIACGSVIPGPCDADVGFVVGWTPARRQRLIGRLGKLRDGGICGNMALRRTVFEQIGGFDEMLGAGAYFPAMEDQEITYRVLAAGHALLHVPEARVVHHGMREWRGGGRFIRRTYIGVAAAFTKHIRNGDAVAALVLLHQMWLAAVNIAAHVGRLRGPFGFGRLGGLFVGIWRSFELEVEPRQALYRSRA